MNETWLEVESDFRENSGLPRGIIIFFLPLIPQTKSKLIFIRFLWLNSEKRLYVYAFHSFYYYSIVQRLKLYRLNIVNYRGSEDIDLQSW